MERVQSKFVIVKQMKELRFCRGVNIELANLWTSKPAPLAATATLSPICVSVCLHITAPVNPEIRLHVKKQKRRRIKHCKFSNFLKSVSSYPSPSPCPKYLCTVVLSISFRPCAALGCVWLKLPLGPGDLPACSLQ